jgi:hypothetical protein
MSQRDLKAKDEIWIKSKRLRIAERQHWRCYWCGQLMCQVPNCPRQVSIDHKIPKHNGGTLRPGNFVAACRECNSGRHPEMMKGKPQPDNLYATTGEIKTPSPFGILQRLFNENKDLCLHQTERNSDDVQPQNGDVCKPTTE